MFGYWYENVNGDRTYGAGDFFTVSSLAKLAHKFAMFKLPDNEWADGTAFYDDDPRVMAFKDYIKELISLTS